MGAQRQPLAAAPPACDSTPGVRQLWGVPRSNGRVSRALQLGLRSKSSRRRREHAASSVAHQRRVYAVRQVARGGGRPRHGIWAPCFYQVVAAGDDFHGLRRKSCSVVLPHPPQGGSTGHVSPRGTRPSCIYSVRAPLGGSDGQEEPWKEKTAPTCACMRQHRSVWYNFVPIRNVQPFLH